VGPDHRQARDEDQGRRASRPCAVEHFAAVKRSAIYSLAPQVPGIGGIFGLLDSLWLLWDKPHRQCLHDKVADTVVIKV
jgi:RDD family